jgi:hypothetical protein
MLEADIEEPPTLAVFILLATYGEWIVVILRTLLAGVFLNDLWRASN